MEHLRRVIERIRMFFGSLTKRIGERRRRKDFIDVTAKKPGTVWLRSPVLMILILFVLLLLAGLIFSNDLLVFWSVFWWLSSSFSNSGVPNEWLTYILALIAAVPLVIGIKYTFSLKWEKRRVGYGILCLWFLAYCGLMYWMSQGKFYTPNGEVVGCYSMALNGDIEVAPCSWKVHPVTGAEVKPITREISYALSAEREGYPVVSTVRVGPYTRLFAPDGTPLYCYYEREDGMIEFFNMPCGAHPRFGNEAQTRPINAQIVKRYSEQIEKEKEPLNQLSPSDNVKTGGKASELEKLKTSLESARVRNP